MRRGIRVRGASQSRAWLERLVKQTFPERRNKSARREKHEYPDSIEKHRQALVDQRPWMVIPGLRLTLTGQLPGGKNRVGIKVTKGVCEWDVGRPCRHPYPRFSQWRKDAEIQLLSQLQSWRVVLPLSVPMLMYVWYTPGDRKIRDRTGMEDALFHLLERAGVVSDDGLIEDPLWRTMPLIRRGARVEIVLRPFLPLPSVNYLPSLDGLGCPHCLMPFNRETHHPSA